MNILRTSNLYKVYGDGDASVHALRPTEIRIDKGEFVIVVGPSGSGKTTLLNLLAGLDKPTVGNVHIKGQNIFDMSETDLTIFRRKNIGFVFQFFNLLPILSLEENVVLPLLLDKKDIDWAYIDELLEILGIKDRRRHLPRALSGGQQQRAAIARALCMKPSIIFADEPTGNLDTKSSNEVMELFKNSVKKYNQTLVMITHNPEISKFADRVLFIEDGMVSNGKVIGREDDYQFYATCPQVFDV